MLRTHEIKAASITALRARISRNDSIEERAERIEELLRDGEHPTLNASFVEFANEAAWNMPLGKAIEEFAHKQAKAEIDDEKVDAYIAAQESI